MSLTTLAMVAKWTTLDDNTGLQRHSCGSLPLPLPQAHPSPHSEYPQPHLHQATCDSRHGFGLTTADSPTDTPPSRGQCPLRPPGSQLYNTQGIPQAGGETRTSAAYVRQGVRGKGGGAPRASSQAADDSSLQTGPWLHPDLSLREQLGHCHGFRTALA